MDKKPRLNLLNKRNVILTLLLALGLSVPYGLKFFYPALEPYPAIIFPAGDGKVRSAEGTFEFNVTNIYCFDLSTEDWEKQDTRSFLDPIPRQYFHGILKNDFGLNPDLEHKIKPKKGPLPSFTYRNSEALEADDIEHTKAWLKGRLQQHNCRDDAFVVRRTRMSVDLDTRAVSEIDIVEEKTFELQPLQAIETNL